MTTPYMITDRLRRRLGSDDYPRRGMNRVANDAAIGDRIQYLASDGSYHGPASDAVPCIAASGGIAINDIVYVSGYDGTTGHRIVDKAQADDVLTCSDLFWAPAAITGSAAGYVRRLGMFVSTLTCPANIGDPVYLSAASAGLVTETIPSGANYVIEVGTFMETGATARVNIDLGGEEIPIHTHADNSQGGTLSAPALTGTTNATFAVDSGGAGSPMILAADIGGATGFTLTLQAASIATGSRVLTFEDPGGADGMVYKALAQTLTNKTIAGTYGTSFTVFQGGGTARLVLDTAGATGNHDYTMTVPNIGGATGNTLPTGDAQYFALTANADGSISTAALTGTTNVSFEVDTGNAVPSIAISADAGGTGDFTATLMPADPLTADRTVLVPDVDDTLVTLAAAQTLTNKTINGATLSGTLTGTVTMSGTWTNLGSVSTVDINGGTIDGTIIGGATPAAITGTTITGTTLTDGSFSVTSGAVTGIEAVTSATGAYAFDYSASTGAFDTSTGTNTLNGNVELVADKNLTLLQGTGYIQINADTSGGIKILPTATTGFLVTIDTDTQGSGVGSLSIIDLNGGDYEFVVTGRNQSIAGVKTFTSVPVVPGLLGQDDPLDITGMTGSTSAGGAVTVAGGIGDGAGNDGGAITATTGAGIADATTGGDSGVLTLLSGAPGTTTTGVAGASGAVSITSGTGGAATGDTSTGGASGAVTLASGTGGAADHATACVGGAGGLVSITGGTGGTSDNATSGGGDGGSIQMYAGIGGASAAGTPGDGGSVTIRAGSGNTNGSISIGATNAAAIAVGRTGIDTTLTGQLFVADETAADDVLDVLTLSKGHNAAAGGVGTGVGIAIRLEDATGYEEKGSLEWVTTDATQATSDVDLEAYLNVGGAITRMMHLDVDDGTASRLVLGADAFRCAIEMHPPTGSRGTFILMPADNTGDTTITFTHAAQSGNNTAEIPDIGAGATDQFVMEDVTQTLTGKTIDGDDNTVQDLAYISPKAAVAVDDAECGLSVLLKFTIVSGDLTDTYTVPAGKTFEVTDVWAVKFAGNGGAGDTVKVANSVAGDITDTMSLNINDKLNVRAAEIDDVSYQVTAGASILVTGVEAGTDVDCFVYVLGFWT